MRFDALLESIMTIEMEGLEWGPSKLVQTNRESCNEMQVMCTIEDAKISIKELELKVRKLKELKVHEFLSFISVNKL